MHVSSAGTCSSPLPPRAKHTPPRCTRERPRSCACNRQCGGGGCPAGKVYGRPGCGVYLMHVSGLQHAEANAVAE